MLDALPQGLFDAVVTGHTHTRLEHFVNGMPVIQSNSYGKQFGVIHLEVDPSKRKSIRSSTRMESAISICENFFQNTRDCDPRKATPGPLVEASFEGKPVAPDKHVDEVIAPFLKLVVEKQSRSLHVQIPKLLTRSQSTESPLGNALADILREMEKTDVVVLNSGGFRADLAKGELTYGAFFEVFPFDNSIATLTLTGDEIIQFLDVLISSGHGVPQISGIKMVIARCNSKPHIGAIRFTDGRQFDRNATYRLTTNSFLATGGDGTAKVLDAVPSERKDLGYHRTENMFESMATWLENRKGKLESKKDHRITFDKSGSCLNDK
jgi:5'-nucleotidase